jgi:poly-beta-1,6-N-acetyl-D-glucosamine synthase
MDWMDDPLHQVLFSAALFFLLIQLFYFFRFYIRVGWAAKREKHEFPGPVSVVICAKNEADNLAKNLPLFFNQQYPQFEVVVVNDCSVDESEALLEEFQRKYTNLHVVNLNEEDIKDHDKKLALTLGIKGAKNNLLLLTDADCVPANENWIASMARNFSSEKEIIVGYGAYHKTGGILNKIIRFDTVMAAIQYLSFADAGRTYMGVGRNLAYTKELFFRHKGFASQYHIRSGDDDLFINKVATRKNVAVEMDKDAFTYSEPKKSFGKWIAQRRRHLTTAKHYKASDKFRLSLIQTANYAFYLLIIALFLVGADVYLTAGLLTFRLIIFLTINGKAMDKLSEMDLLFFSPIFELIMMILNPIIYLSNSFIKQPKWK